MIWLALPFALLLASCGGPSAAAAAAGPAMPPPVVTIGAVQVKTIPIYADFVGQTDSKETVNIIPRVTGFLEKIYFREGAEVRAGEALFQIERASYKAALQSAEAKLAQDQAALVRYQRDVARLQPLVNEQAATQQDLDVSISGAAQQGAAIQAAQAAIDTAKLNLSYTLISSPIDGIIGKLNVTAGNLVNSNQATALATISSFDPIYVYFTVPESVYLTFRRKSADASGPPPLSLSLLLADNQKFPHSGRIDFIDRAVDPQTGTLRVRATFPNPKSLLRPGQFARVRFVSEERRDAVLVPKEAVTEMLNSKSVLLVDSSNRTSLRTIATDGEFEKYFVVHSGLAGGENVVVEGASKVRPGMPVTPAPAGGGK